MHQSQPDQSHTCCQAPRNKNKKSTNLQTFIKTKLDKISSNRQHSLVDKRATRSISIPQINYLYSRQNFLNTENKMQSNLFHTDVNIYINPHHHSRLNDIQDRVISDKARATQTRTQNLRTKSNRQTRTSHRTISKRKLLIPWLMLNTTVVNAIPEPMVNSHNFLQDFDFTSHSEHDFNVYHDPLDTPNLVELETESLVLSPSSPKPQNNNDNTNRPNHNNNNIVTQIDDSLLDQNWNFLDVDHHYLHPETQNIAASTSYGNNNNNNNNINKFTLNPVFSPVISADEILESTRPKLRRGRATRRKHKSKKRRKHKKRLHKYSVKNLGDRKRHRHKNRKYKNNLGYFNNDIGFGSSFLFSSSSINFVDWKTVVKY